MIHTSDEEEEEEYAGGETEENAEVADAKKEKEFLSLEEKQARAKEVTVNRILTDADFKKIDAAQLKKQVRMILSSCLVIGKSSVIQLF